MLNETHDASLSSWVGTSDEFPIQNLPIAIFKSGDMTAFAAGIAICDQILNLQDLAKTGLLSGDAAIALDACQYDTLNDYMGLGASYHSALRLAVSRLLRTGSEHEQLLRTCLYPMTEAEYGMPCHIGDYTDFYTSIYHATSVGKLFRPDNPLLPNYKWVPIGYHGRASSVDVSPQNFKRPSGQTKAPDAAEPSFGPCKRLDYELELGIFVGQGNELGEAVDIERAEQHVFGICLFNDWSARDLQAWEYQPLGPFLAKNFASTISPWIITMEALAPYRVAFQRPSTDPQPLPYLSSEENSERGAIDIQLSVHIQTEQMAEQGMAPVELSRSSFKHSYWTVAQMLTHHTVNGCNLKPGDLLGSGTQSGPEPAEAGSLLELSGAGKRPISLPSGETRTFLEDGDTVILRGFCGGENGVRIGLGEATGKVLAND